MSDIADKLGIELSASYDDVLADPAVEAVVLATPHNLHESQIERAVAAGKHIFCEKPLALTKEGAEKAVRLWAARKLVLGTGHERRYEPPIADLIDQAVQGRLGRLLQIEANFSHDRFLSLDPSNWRLSPAQAPAAGMTATGIHLTDLAVKLMGKAADVPGRLRELGLGATAGRHAKRAHTLRDRRLGLCLGYPGDTVFRPFCGVWDTWLDRRSRQGPCRETGGLDRYLRSDRNGYRGAGRRAGGTGAGQS